MGDVRSGFTDVPAHLAHDTNMLIAVQQRIFSSLPPGLPPLWTARYVSRLAFDRTTISRCESLSLAAMGTCCSATSLGSSGGGVTAFLLVVSAKKTRLTWAGGLEECYKRQE